MYSIYSKKRGKVQNLHTTLYCSYLKIAAIKISYMFPASNITSDLHNCNFTYVVTTYGQTTAWVSVNSDIADTLLFVPLLNIVFKMSKIELFSPLHLVSLLVLLHHGHHVDPKYTVHKVIK